jgi:hypothetical protein
VYICFNNTYLNTERNCSVLVKRERERERETERLCLRESESGGDGVLRSKGRGMGVNLTNLEHLSACRGVRIK